MDVAMNLFLEISLFKWDENTGISEIDSDHRRQETANA